MHGELTDLLKTHPIVHPSVMERVEFSGGRLRMLIRGNPWWRSGGSREQDRIEFIFEDVFSGQLCLDTLGVENWDDDEILKDFAIHPEEDRLRVQFGGASFLCARAFARYDD